MLLRVALTQINPDSRQGYTKGASRRGDAVSRQRGAGGSGKAHGHPPGNAKEQGSRAEKGDAPEPLRPQRSPPLRLAALTSPLPRASRGGGAEALPCRAVPAPTAALRTKWLRGAGAQHEGASPIARRRLPPRLLCSAPEGSGGRRRPDAGRRDTQAVPVGERSGGAGPPGAGPGPGAGRARSAPRSAAVAAGSRAGPRRYSAAAPAPRAPAAGPRPLRGASLGCRGSPSHLAGPVAGPAGFFSGGAAPVPGGQSSRPRLRRRSAPPRRGLCACARSRDSRPGARR